MAESLIAMPGDSVANALAALIFGMMLPLLGYDVRLDWPWLEELAFIAAGLCFVGSLAIYGMRELAEGEYD
jgi:hypothetical protein